MQMHTQSLILYRFIFNWIYIGRNYNDDVIVRNSGKTSDSHNHSKHREEWLESTGKFMYPP